MTNQKKNIDISERLLKSFKLGFISSILLFLLLHLINVFRNDWSGWEGQFREGNISIGWKHDMSYSIEDWFLGTKHSYTGNTSYMDLEKITPLKFKDSLSSTFDGHLLHILILGIILSLLFYFFSKYKINVTK